ncbi:MULTISPECIES: hypothetical protein [Burkholderia]|uniref:hypothetical protein n=1 Tax=Burkholderia TaxID=32008 RepID=UPI0011AEEC1A|nr:MULTISPECIES: hypothetical protein [unclassified Burkholderia]
MRVMLVGGTSWNWGEWSLLAQHRYRPTQDAALPDGFHKKCGEPLGVWQIDLDASSDQCNDEPDHQRQRGMAGRPYVSSSTH